MVALVSLARVALSWGVMHGTRCASQMCWPHCSSGLQPVNGAWSVFGELF